MTMEAELRQIAEKIDTKMGTMASAIEAVQTKQTELEGKEFVLPDEIKSSVTTASEEASKALESINELKTQSASIASAQEFLEKSISRMSGNSDADDGQLSEMESKAKDEMTNYIRNRSAISEDTHELIVKSMLTQALHGVDENRIASEVKTLAAGSNPDGGYFIRPQMSADMIRRIFESSPMRALASQATTTSDAFEIIIDDEQSVSGGWVGEVDDRDETATPKIGKLTIPIHEQFAQPMATQKMLDDAGFDIESWLGDKNVDIMSRTENTAFVRGDGSQKPRGILTLPDWNAAGVYERGKLERRNSGASGAFTADSIIQLQNDLIEEYQANATFAVKRKSFGSILTLKDGQQQYLINPTMLRDGADKVLLGKPVVFMNDLDELVANGQSMIYGDFRAGYTIVDRIGFRVIRDNITKKGFIKFYTTKRTGGDVTNYQALKIMRLAA